MWTTLMKAGSLQHTWSPCTVLRRKMHMHKYSLLERVGGGGERMGVRVGGKLECFSLLPAEEVYITINRYSAEHHDEVTFEKGVLVEVFEKGLDGWWKIR